MCKAIGYHAKAKRKAGYAPLPNPAVIKSRAAPLNTHYAPTATARGQFDVTRPARLIRIITTYGQMKYCAYGIVCSPYM